MTERCVWCETFYAAGMTRCLRCDDMSERPDFSVLMTKWFLDAHGVEMAVWDGPVGEDTCAKYSEADAREKYLLGLIERVEWYDYEGRPFLASCPLCNMSKPDDAAGVHAPDCDLGQVLQEFRGRDGTK